MYSNTTLIENWSTIHFMYSEEDKYSKRLKIKLKSTQIQVNVFIYSLDLRLVHNTFHVFRSSQLQQKESK